VRREQLVVGEPVERPDDGKQAHGEPGREERDPVPAREVGPAAPAQPHDGLGEEKSRDCGGDHRNHEFDCAGCMLAR
jgi:hypothetical protein